jgi:CubicO group peptidase (beta-lactamase class C family)
VVSGAKVHSSDKVAKSIEPFVQELARADRFSGVVAIARDGRVLFERPHGLADYSTRAPIQLDTKFVIASVTQTLTAVAILQLVAQGKTSLEAPLSAYLPDYPIEGAKAATVRQLLLHTAAIGDAAKAAAFRRAPRSYKTLADYLSLIQAEPLSGEPGAEFRYTDGDCVLLGAIIEKVSGQSYYDYVRDHIFKPAGMKGSGFDLYPKPPGLATGYTSRNLGTSEYSSAQGQRQTNEAILPTRASPGFAAYSTAGDLIRFGTALLRHQLLSRVATDNLLRGRVATNDTGPRQQYGFGFFDGRTQNLRIVNHGGTGPGIDVGFDLYPDLGYVVVVMSNYDPPAAQRVRDELRARLSAGPIYNTN